VANFNRSLVVDIKNASGIKDVFDSIFEAD